MVVRHEVRGYEEFKKLIGELEEEKASEENFFIHILFIGDKGEDGNSWCPYCETAEPIINESLKVASESSHFVVVSVGDKEYWRNIDCPFRKDPNTSLVMVPTLIRWKSPQRLEGKKCSNKDLVIFLLSDIVEGEVEETDNLKEKDKEPDNDKKSEC